MDKFSLINCPKFLDNAISPAAKEIGITLSNIFYLVFSPINYNVEKLKIKHMNNLKSYERDIQTEISKIPEENLMEPSLNLVGPALEASKFYIETDVLRKMFAKLIAASMNSEKTSKAHNYFVEVIKQLSPLDSINLKFLLNYKDLRLLEFLYAADMLKDNSFGDFHRQNVSLDNLERLGLISIIDVIPLDKLITDITRKTFEESKRGYYKNDIYTPHINDLEAKKIILSALGRDFCSICI